MRDAMFLTLSRAEEGASGDSVVVTRSLWLSMRPVGNLPEEVLSTAIRNYMDWLEPNMFLPQSMT